MKTSWVYLTVAQVLAIHDQLIDRFGGSHGIRDVGLIESALARPQSSFDDADLYPDIYSKAAALLQSLLKNHPFIDGNKRTALTSAGIFLELNAVILTNYHQDEVEFAIRVDNQNLTLEQIAKWLQDHSQKS